jgi:hypothetical protein
MIARSTSVPIVTLLDRPGPVAAIRMTSEPEAAVRAAGIERLAFAPSAHPNRVIGHINLLLEIDSVPESVPAQPW